MVSMRGAHAAVVLALVLAACSGDDSQTQGDTEETPSPQVMQPGAEDAGDGQAGGEARSPFADPSELYEPQDGTWPVGDAGEVEFEAGGDSLDLVDARPESGWEVSVDERDDDEIKVDFVRDNVRWEFEVETDDGQLEIEIRQDVIPAEPGRFAVGDAGVVEVAVDGDRVELVDMRAADGWRNEIREDDEVEVDFRRSGARWDFEAEFDDGRLEVQIDLKVGGNAG